MTNRYLTAYLDPYKKVNCEYGNITNGDWVEREQKQIKGCSVVKDEDGNIALLKDKEK